MRESGRSASERHFRLFFLRVCGGSGPLGRAFRRPFGRLQHIEVAFVQQRDQGLRFRGGSFPSVDLRAVRVEEFLKRRFVIVP